MFTFTFHDLLTKNLADRGDHPLVLHGREEFSYSDIACRVEALAAWLAEQGIGRGDRVVLQLRKSIDEVVVMFAAARLGAMFVNINHQWTVRQLDFVLRDCEPGAVFVEARMARKLAETGVPESVIRIIVKGRPPDHPLMLAWEHVLADLPAPEPIGIGSDPVAILYTSGSTGSPKGVVLTNSNLVQGARSVACYLDNRPADRLLSVLPFSFDYGLSQLTTMCLVGGTVVLHLVMMPVEIVKALVEHNITGLAAVPPLWNPLVRFLADYPGGPPELPDLRYVTNSGGSIPATILREMPRVFPDVQIFLMYGLTEAFRSTYLPPALFEEKMGSMGRDAPDAETFVVNPELGVCGPGQQGELVHRGPLVSLGYWRRPEETADKIKPCPQLRHIIGDEPVLYSGDLVRIDDAGYYWFVGRKDDLIKVSGFRISPTEVEEIVFQFGLVDEVVAFGVEDEELRQNVAVAVSTPDNVGLDEEHLLDFCRRQMPSYMVPREVYHLPGPLPRTASGKLDRPAIIARCKAEASGGEQGQ